MSTVRCPNTLYIHDWFRRFSDVEFNYDDSALSEVDSDRLRQLIDSDPRQTRHELAKVLGVHFITIVDHLCLLWVTIFEESAKCNVSKTSQIFLQTITWFQPLTSKIDSRLNFDFLCWSSTSFTVSSCWCAEKIVTSHLVSLDQLLPAISFLSYIVGRIILK